MRFFFIVVKSVQTILMSVLLQAYPERLPSRHAIKMNSICRLFAYMRRSA